MIYFLTAIG